MLRRGVSAHFLLQQIFPSQGSNPRLLPWKADSLLLSHQGQLRVLPGYGHRRHKGGSHSERMEWRTEWDVQKRAECREKTVTLAPRVCLGMQRLDQ